MSATTTTKNSRHSCILPMMAGFWLPSECLVNNLFSKNFTGENFHTAFSEPNPAVCRQELLLELCHLFLGCVLPPGALPQAICNDINITTIASKDDMAFLILLLETYWDIWKDMAQIKKQKEEEAEATSAHFRPLLRQRDSKKIKKHGEPAQEKAQERLREIREVLWKVFPTGDDLKNFGLRFREYHQRNHNTSTRARRQEAKKRKNCDLGPSMEYNFL